MGNIKVADYLINLTKYDDIVRDKDNRIVLDKYIERIHADGMHCHKPHYHGTKEPKKPYSIYRLKSPYSIYLAKERRNSSSPDKKENVEKTTKVHNEAIFGKIYNDVGVNAVEGSVAYANTVRGKLFYSITQHLKTLSNVNKDKVAFHAPNFFFHICEMLDKKEEYLKSMTEGCFDDLVNTVLASIISGETDMNGANTFLLKHMIGKCYTDVCRVGTEEHCFDDLVESNASYQDIKKHFEETSHIYSNSFSSASSRTVLTPKRQIELIRDYAKEGYLSPSNMQVIENLANYDVDACFADRKEEVGALLTDTHKDCIKFYLSQAEKIL